MLNRELGAYRPEAIVAAGSYAKLYTVQNRPELVLKTLPDTLTDDASFKTRFEMTLEALVQLEHRHLLRLHDYGVEGTVPYLVMPRLVASLEDRLSEQSTLSSPEILAQLAGIADALDYLHRQGFTHQDVKTSNILFDADGKAYLADLGVLALMQETYSLLGLDVPKGTSAYLAPEQWRGESVTRASDIYALGVVAFQCLTGQLPFSTEATDGLQDAITHNTPQLPTHLNPALPSAIDEVFLKVLAKQPSRRFRAASDMIAALQATFSAPTTDEAPPTAPPKPAPTKMTPFQLARRLGCGVILALWFGLMLSPCVVITVLVEGEFIINLSDRPNHRLRMFDVDTDDKRGFGFSMGNIERENETELCVITRVRYVMWRGENEPVNFCQCYTQLQGQWVGGPVLDQHCEQPRQLSQAFQPKPTHFYHWPRASE